MFLHAHNPWGWAWMRRVNEDNIDLNRNYCEFDKPFPRNEDYELVRELLLPDQFDDDARAAIQQWIAGPRSREIRHGSAPGSAYRSRRPFFLRRFSAYLVPSYSSRCAASPCGAVQRRVWLVDLHTGLGEFGQGTILHTYPKRLGNERGSMTFGTTVKSREDMEVVDNGPAR